LDPNYLKIINIMYSKKTLISSLVAALLFSQASAWWSTGHMMVARVAFDKLNRD